MKYAKNWREMLEKGEESLTKQEKIDLSNRYHKTFELKQELYKLMKKIIDETGLGEEDDDYCEALHLYIGDGELMFDPYYQTLTYNEDEIEEGDYETVKKLISEIKKRYRLYKSKTKNNKKIAENIFAEELNIKLDD